MRGMMTVMAFMKCTWIRWKAFGLCCAHGYALIAVSRRTIYHSTWASLSLCTTWDDEGKRCLGTLLELLLT